MRNKIIILSFLLAFVLISTVAFAQDNEENLPEAGITPDSPFHVFERFGEWVRLNILTFNPIRKAEIKIEIAEKRLAELRALVELDASGEIINRAEAFVSSKTEEAENDLERFDSEGLDASVLVEKFSELSLKQQAVLEGVLDKAPEQSKEAIKHALEVSRHGLNLSSEVALKQKEKGHLDEERARRIFERSVGVLQTQLVRRSEDLKRKTEELGEVPPELQELLEEKIKLLEGQVFTVESRDELRVLRQDINDRIKEAARIIVDARRDHKLNDEEIEEALEDIEKNEFRPVEKSEEMITEAEQQIAEVEDAILEAESNNMAIHESVRRLLENAKKNLADAKAAFEQENYGLAFGHAVAANHNAKAALRFMKFTLEGEDKAQKAISEAQEEIAEFETKIEEFKIANDGRAPEIALRVFNAAKDQLLKAETAFAAGDLRRAFAHAEAAKHMADRGQEILDREQGILEKRRDLENETLDRKMELDERTDLRSKQLDIKSEVEVNKDDVRTKIDTNVLQKDSSVTDVKKDDTSTDSAFSASTIVKITQNGFEPREIKIKKGGTVIWVNEKGTASWPASAVHPTHSVYPQKGGCLGSAFDACRRVSDGETYEFRFDHAGTWRYHDHLNPSITGTVLVVE